jgi:hypothetical protein
MNNEEVKKTLALYRPGSADRIDPSFNEAVERARPHPPNGRWAEKPDPELGRWFRAHCSSYLSIRARFLEIPVPPELKDRILDKGKIVDAPAIPFRPMGLLWAAVFALCFCLIAFFWRSHGRENDFNIYRQRMARTALQPYGMDLPSYNLQAINTYLAGRKAPTDYILPKGMLKAQPVGCAVLQWQGEPVSMLCFQSGQPLPAGEKMDLWLFIIDQPALRNGPAAASPVVARVMDLTTATWTEQGKTYILAGAGDEEFLRKYF